MSGIIGVQGLNRSAEVLVEPDRRVELYQQDEFASVEKVGFRTALDGSLCCGTPKVQDLMGEEEVAEGLTSLLEHIVTHVLD